ncbi:MAG: transposase [Terracidiphilus sp.]|jgi:hypothetical protein
MAERVRASHVVAADDTIMPMLSKGKAANARISVYVVDDGYPYNMFNFTLSRGRDGPKCFLKDYRQVQLADAYGGYNGVVTGNEITRAGILGAHKEKSDRRGNGCSRDRTRSGRAGARSLCNRKVEQRCFCRRALEAASAVVGVTAGPIARAASAVERTVAA